MRNLLIFVIVLFYQVAWATESPLQKFAFGSCNDQNAEQPLWPSIIDSKPEFFMWLGDNIYGDTKNPAKLAKKYQKQLSHPGYQELLSSVPIIGTWDDHDYGDNNIGKNNPIKKESQKLFLDFIGEPEDSKRRRQKGIYTSYTYGPTGQQVKIILLDTRYFQEKPNQKGSDLLGETQWQWLEKELKRSSAKAHFIVSSISVLSKGIAFVEGWASFPESQRRLFKILKKTQPSGVVFLTGDRHFAGFIKKKRQNKNYFELMSSGMTHVFKKRFLVKSIYGKGNFFLKKNYGVIDLDWSKRNLEMSFEARDKNGNPGLVKKFVLNDGFWQTQKLTLTPLYHQ